MIIAYDLDGVICPDINLPWQDPNFDFKALFELRYKLPPLFHPTGVFYIITGRPHSDKDHTEKWCKMYNIHPNKVFYNSNDPNELDKVALHKANTLNKLMDVFVFVESDHKQVQTIKQLTTKTVYHFSEFVSRGINEALSRLPNV